MGALPKVGDLVDPPAATHSGGRHSSHQLLLDAADGRWVVLYVGNAAAGNLSRMKLTKWFNAGAYEVTSRKCDDGRVAIYGRAVR